MNSGKSIIGNDGKEYSLSVPTKKIMNFVDKQ